MAISYAVISIVSIIEMKLNFSNFEAHRYWNGTETFLCINFKYKSAVCKIKNKLLFFGNEVPFK